MRQAWIRHQNSMRAGWTLLTMLVVLCGIPGFAAFFDDHLSSGAYASWSILTLTTGITGSFVLLLSVPNSLLRLACGLLGLCLGWMTFTPGPGGVMGATLLLMGIAWLFYRDLGMAHPRLGGSGCLVAMIVIPPLWPLLVLGLYLTLLAYYLGLAWNWPALVEPEALFVEVESVPEREERAGTAPLAVATEEEDDSDWTRHQAG